MTAGEAILLAAGPVMALILVGNGLARRRLPARRLLVLAAAWAVIILLAWAVATFGLRPANFT